MNKKILLLCLISFTFLHGHSACADEATSTPDVVADTTAPIITPPADQTFATSTFPAFPVLNMATATDIVDPLPVITSDAPASFSAGTTTVTWTATDASGNSATTTSKIGVFLNIDTSVYVPANCEATDTDGVVHTYVANSTTSYLAICALSVALSSSTVSSAQLSNQYPSMGLFVTGIAGVVADPNSQYWALYQNGDYASLGLTQLPVVSGDFVTIQLHDFSDNSMGSQVTFRIASLISTTTTATSTPETTSDPAPSAGGGGTSGIFMPQHRTFNLATALQFLESKQKSDGSFGSSLYSDWAVIALAAAGDIIGRDARVQNLTTIQPELSSVTDYERHAMALMAAGINPYSGTSVNYIQKIVDKFDGTQVGDASLINDDIFALFPLLRAGYSDADSIVQKIIENIILKQNSNGSWENSVDITAAAIQALELTPNLPNVSKTLSLAKIYLVNNQKSDGGFGSSYSTSWAMQAISALGENTTAWLKGDLSPEDSLYAFQQSDGGIEITTADTNTRIWATSYAIPASLHKPWASVLQSFAKPTVTTASASGSSISNTAIATSTSATSTVAVASTTPVIIQATTTVATTTEAVPDDSPLRAPEGSRLNPKPETPITKPVVKSIKKIVPRVIETKVAVVTTSVNKPKPTAPVANVASALPNLPPVPHPVKTFSLLASLLFLIALL